MPNTAAQFLTANPNQLDPLTHRQVYDINHPVCYIGPGQNLHGPVFDLDALRNNNSSRYDNDDHTLRWDSLDSVQWWNRPRACVGQTEDFLKHMACPRHPAQYRLFRRLMALDLVKRQIGWASQYWLMHPAPSGAKQQEVTQEQFLAFRLHMARRFQQLLLQLHAAAPTAPSLSTLLVGMYWDSHPPMDPQIEDFGDMLPGPAMNCAPPPPFPPP